MISLVGASLAFLLLTGVTVWTLPRARRWWVGALGAVLLFGAPLGVAVHLYVLVQHGGSPDVAKDGRYFTRSRGQLTEVPEDTWYALRWYERVTWVVTPVGGLAGLFLLGGYLNAVHDRQMGEQLRDMMARREGRGR